MAYSTSNPPVLISQGIAGFWRMWAYKSTDAPAAVRLNNYFSNGWQLGMRANDLIIVCDTDASPLTMQLMIVNSASASGVDCSDGVAVTATDTD